MQKIKRLDKRRSIIPISDRVKGGNRHWRHLEYEHHVFARIGISQLYILRSCDIHECNHDYCSLSTIDLISTCPWYPQRCIVGPHFQLSFSQLSLYICSTGFRRPFRTAYTPDAWVASLLSSVPSGSPSVSISWNAVSTRRGNRSFKTTIWCCITS